MTSKRSFQGWRLFICGLCMGAADLVPGISGGTIAFILGFYEPLLTNLKKFNLTALDLLLTRKWKQLLDYIPWKFFLILFAGICCAFVCFANLLHYILGHELYRVYLYAIFFGLILASFVFCVRQVHIWSKRMLFGLFLGVLLGFLLTAKEENSVSRGIYAIEINLGVQDQSLINYHVQEKLLTGLNSQDLIVLLSHDLIQPTSPIYDNEHTFVGVVSDFANPKEKVRWFDSWLVLCGACAICGLLLPGISGSYILTLLGVYPVVMEALVDFLNSIGAFKINFEAFSILANLAMGIFFGGIIFSCLLSRLLKNYPNQALAILSGIMIGSIRTLWPFQTYQYALVPFKLHKGAQLIPINSFMPSLDSLMLWYSFAFALIGFSVVFFLDACAKKAKVF